MKTTTTALLGMAATLFICDAAFAQHGTTYCPQQVITRRPYVRAAKRIVQPSYVYGARQHLDELADQLRNQAKAITWEMYHNYQHNPHFTETYTEMYELLTNAEHIHDLVHANTYHHASHGVDHIATDLHNIDALFHHIEDDIEHWSPAHQSRHFTRVHGNLHTKIEAMEETLHHLMEDYGARSNAGGNPPQLSTPPAPSTTALPPPAPSTAFIPTR